MINQTVVTKVLAAKVALAEQAEATNAHLELMVTRLTNARRQFTHTYNDLENASRASATHAGKKKRNVWLENFNKIFDDLSRCYDLHEDSKSEVPGEGKSGTKFSFVDRESFEKVLQLDLKCRTIAVECAIKSLKQTLDSLDTYLAPFELIFDDFLAVKAQFAENVDAMMDNLVHEIQEMGLE